jgi:hypothetical protein
VQFVPLLLTYPIGTAWARYLPKVSLFGMSLNPGPFTIKEHVIIVIMATVSNGPAYAVSAEFDNILRCDLLCFLQPFQTNIIAVQRVFYKQHPNLLCTFDVKINSTSIY